MNISSTASSAGSGRWIHRLVIAGAALAALAVPHRVHAQDPNLVDQGRFDIRLGDRAAGTETFAIRRQGEGYMAVGRIQLEGTGTWLRSAEVVLRTDGTFVPMRYRFESRADDRGTVDLSRTGTRIRVTTSSAEGERVKELLANPSHVLLGPGIAQHYYFLIRRLSVGRGGAIALVPGEGREASVRVVGTTDTTVAIGDEQVPARRWELTVDGTTHFVWHDPADGRILRVEIPERRWRSVRQPEE